MRQEEQVYLTLNSLDIQEMLAAYGMLIRFPCLKFRSLFEQDLLHLQGEPLSRPERGKLREPAILDTRHLLQTPITQAVLSGLGVLRAGRRPGGNCVDRGKWPDLRHCF